MRCLILLSMSTCIIALSTRADAKKAPTLGAKESVASRSAALASALGFAAVASDVFVTKRIMPKLDDTAQRIAGDAANYDNPAGRALSNLAPALLTATGAACGLTPKQDRRRAIAVLGTWIMVNPVVLGLKNAFKRERPDPIHHVEYSFPSGHTTNAAFLSAALFTVVLPPFMKGDRDARTAVPPSLIALTALCTAGVAAGRVLTQAHFFSDTIAGAFLGIFMATIAAYLGRAVPEQPPDIDRVL